jgi:hypothetical protein
MRPETVIRTIVDSAGKHRVLILQRPDGAFTFEAQYWSDEPLEMCWIPRGERSVCICESEETAMREALGRVDWLAAAIGSAA